MGCTYSFKTKYCSKEITIEYEVDGSSSPTTYSPMHGADGGDSPAFLIEDVYSEQGTMLYNQRQSEKWEEMIAMEHVEDYDYDDGPYD